MELEMDIIIIVVVSSLLIFIFWIFFFNIDFAGILMSHGDYIKSPLSAPSEDIDNLSQHSDFVDEDDRPVSPQVF